MDERLSPEELSAFLATASEALKPIFASSVIPIVCLVEGVPVQYGTGTLLRIAGESFLITAHHVFQEIADQDLVPHIFDGRQGTDELVALDPPADSFCDPFDVSILRLSQRVVDALPNRKFLRLSGIDLSGTQLRRGLFYVFGYPSCWWEVEREKREVRGMAVLHPGTLYDGRTDHLLRYDPRFHILLEGCKAAPTALEGPRLGRWSRGTEQAAAVSGKPIERETPWTDGIRRMRGSWPSRLPSTRNPG